MAGGGADAVHRAGEVALDVEAGGGRGRAAAGAGAAGSGSRSWPGALRCVWRVGCRGSWECNLTAAQGGAGGGDAAGAVCWRVLLAALLRTAAGLADVVAAWRSAAAGAARQAARLRDLTAALAAWRGRARPSAPSPPQRRPPRPAAAAGLGWVAGAPRHGPRRRLKATMLQ